MSERRTGAEPWQNAPHGRRYALRHDQLAAARRDRTVMQKLRYTAHFTTPAFLGNAHQSGQWRTPPFKALLRQWWRVVWAAKHGFREDVDAMRRDEGLLFGNAGPNGESRKSQVRIRLDRWDEGRETKRTWDSGPGVKIRHPEVEQPIGPLLYLGYGPLEAPRAQRPGSTHLKQNAAIQAGETTTLSIAAPDTEVEDIRSALALIDAYGAAGGRSRNGWGSLSLAPNDGTPAHATRLSAWTRPWQEALALDWAHAIGRDETGPLAWQTDKAYPDWQTLMHHLANLKIGLRTMFVFPKTGPPHNEVHERHWLAYPITRHGTSRWKNNSRLPNSLRFKVRPDRDNPDSLRGVVFHAPCTPPPDFAPQREAIEGVWTRSHRLLDELCLAAPARKYSMIRADDRRRELKQQLDSIALERIAE